MIRKVFFLAIVGNLWISPSFAQAALGGPSKSQNYIGGSKAQKNPVVPPPRGAVLKTEGNTQKPPKH